MRPPKPFTNPNELAVTVFAHPWFSAEEGAETRYETKRQQVFGLKTIGSFRQEYLRNGPRKFRGLLLATNVRPERVKEYFETLDISTRQKCAERIFIETFGGKFQTVDIIDIGSSLDGLLHGASNDNRILDLHFLDDLRLPQDQEMFLVPEKIYVRDCMRDIFGLFVEDVSEEDSTPKKRPGQFSTAFIGSSGVGKAILTFCAALYQAQTTHVIYYRHTYTNVEKDSVFVMTPGNSHGKVTVWFNRNLLLTDKGGLDGFSNDVERFVIDRDDYYAYINGPCHDDEENTFDGRYDYLCTSGGFRYYKSEEYGKRLWILDGWKRSDAVPALKMYGFTKKQADEAYDLCGGNIRTMLEVCREGRSKFEKRLKYLLLRFDLYKLKLVTFDCTRQVGGPETLRTMFQSCRLRSKEIMSPVQLVDSQFVLKESQSELDIDNLISGYNPARNLCMVSAQAAYFDAIVHLWVTKNRPRPAV